MDVLDLRHLSHSQKRIWYTARLHKPTAMWNNAGTLEINGEVDLRLLKRAINIMLEKCPSLRTRIIVCDGQPMQHILPFSPVEIETLDFVDCADATAWERRVSSAVTDCEDCALFYFAILNCGKPDHVSLYVRIHHIISDAWSLVTLANQITEAYDRLLCGDFGQNDCGQDDCGQFTPFSEHIESEDAYLSSPRCQKDLKSLLEKFENAPPPLNLKNQPNNPNNKNKTAAEKLSFLSAAAKVSEISDFCAKSGVSVFSFMLSVFALSLYKQSGKKEFVVGTSILNRADEREKNIFGMMVSTVPLFVKINAGDTFLQLNEQLDLEILSAMRSQKYPFNLLIEQLRKTNKGLSSLFDVTLSFQNGVLKRGLRRFSYKLHWHSPLSQVNCLDVHFFDREGGDCFVWDYNFLTSVFGKEDIRLMQEGIESLISDALKNPHKKLSQFSALSFDGKKQLFKDLSGEATNPPDALTVAELFSKRALIAPESAAVVFKDKVMTAGELSGRANGLCQRLAGRSVGSGDIVAVLMRRSHSLFVALMGILKTGAAFLPIDPDTPADRVSFIAKKSGAKAVVAGSEFRQLFEGDLGLSFISSEELDDIVPVYTPVNADPQVNIKYDPSSLAYVIFTSGTTGEPKGVMIENHSICRFLHSFSGIMEFSPGINTLCVASTAFDLFLMESLPALCNGGTVVLAADDDVKIPDRLAGLVKKHNVNSIMFTPSKMRLLLSGGGGEALKNVKQIMLGGEALSESLVDEIKKYTKADIYNFYGPTEATIAATYKKIVGAAANAAASAVANSASMTENLTGASANSAENLAEKITIGRPLPGVQAYIIDADGGLAARGREGELWIGGDCLARGYIGDATKTAAAFVPDPFKGGETVYKTGDIVRLNNCGELEYIGRTDNQVKIRGYRIELDEISCKLTKIHGVSDCVVTTLEDEEKGRYICAYVCGKNLPDSATLRGQLSQTLPHYMIPAVFVALSSIPLTLGGKVDYKALPAPSCTTDYSVDNTVSNPVLMNHSMDCLADNSEDCLGGEGIKNAETESRKCKLTPTEMILADIWQQVLKVKPKSCEDNFFALGGDSMSIISVSGRVMQIFNVDVSLSEVYENPTLSGYAALIDAAERENLPAIKRQTVFEYPASDYPDSEYIDSEKVASDYPVSSGQRSIYFLTERDGSVAYNMPAAFKLKSRPDKGRLERTFLQLIRLHPSLRTAFFIKDGELKGRIQDCVHFKLETFKCDKGEVDRLLKSLVVPFDFVRPPLLRAGLIEVLGGSWIIFIDMHHIVSDGVSAEILFKELSSLYSTKSGLEILNKDLDKSLNTYSSKSLDADSSHELNTAQNTASDCTDNGFSYADYSVWQGECIKSEGFKRKKEYWLKQMSGVLPQLSLRTDFSRKRRQSFKGRAAEFSFSDLLSSDLRSYAAKNGKTIFSVLLGAFYIFLARQTGDEDIIVGVPAAGRVRAEFEKTVGMFVNTLALRAPVSADKKCGEFLAEVGKIIAGGMANQDYPFEILVSDLKVKREPSRNPLFDVFFSYNTAGLCLKLDDERAVEKKLKRNTAKFDLTFELRDTPKKIYFCIEYCSDLFAKSTVCGFAEHYINILGEIVADDSKAIKDIEMLASVEKKRLLDEMTGTVRTLPDGLSFESALLARAQKMPDAPAIIFGEERVSFAELILKSRRLAGLLKTKGVGAGSVVAVSLPRSAELLASIIGVLLAGGAYLPIDPDYPLERIEYMLRDSGAVALLAMDKRAGVLTITPAEAFSDPPIVFQTEGLGVLPQTEDSPQADGINVSAPQMDSADTPLSCAAYLLYTSGSTGNPKGVLVSRANLINFCEMWREHSLFSAGDVSVSVTTVSFDIFVLEFLAALYYGATVALTGSEQQRVPKLLARFITDVKADFIQFTPSRLSLMLEDREFCKSLAGIKNLICGGEPFSYRLLLKLRRLTNARIFNSYAPTETTVYSSLKDLTKSRLVTIGKPLLNTYFYILDKNMKPVPRGAAGEIYIGGAGVAIGYHNQEKLTEERFLPDFIRGYGRMYKTGDLACLTQNGEIAYLGRVDDQIKFGGHRIEPAEIERAMLGLSKITAAAVAVRPSNGVDKLCAFYLGSEVKPEDIRAYLKKSLPVYMLPAHYTLLDSLPLTPSGKVDRKSLPNLTLDEQENAAENGQTSCAIPFNSQQQKMASIWAKILGVTPRCLDDDFFLLGGDSAAVIRLQIELMKIGEQLKTQDFYQNSTLSALCRHLNGGKNGKKRNTEHKKGEKKAKEYPAHLPTHLSSCLSLAETGGFSLENVLLTGATGFLGAHILKQLSEAKDRLSKTKDGLSESGNIRVVCLVRGESNPDSRNRLEKTLFYYFKTEAAKIMAGVEVLCGDLAEDTNILSSAGKIDTVINCAAVTRHYGDERLFTRANVTTVKELIEFCKANNAALCHISTASVSGSYVDKEKNPIEKENETVYADFKEESAVFSEEDFYIGQDYADNPYVKSKFEAEAAIINAAEGGLRARILRIGNLMPRYSDGVFQLNADKNAFFNRMKAIKLMGVVPLDLIKSGVEFTPVDQCAAAVILLLRGGSSLIYHVLNPIRATGSDLIDALSLGGKRIRAANSAEFKKEVEKIAQSDSADILSGIVEDLALPASKGLPVKVVCFKTVDALSRLGFKWKKPDKDYLLKAFEGKFS